MKFETYPRVLKKPHTLPSAYNDTISPKCKRLAEPIILSPILPENSKKKRKKHKNMSGILNMNHVSADHLFIRSSHNLDIFFI